MNPLEQYALAADAPSVLRIVRVLVGHRGTRRPERFGGRSRPDAPPRPRHGYRRGRRLAAHPLPHQVQERHLSAHDRRPGPDGPLRLQAEDGRLLRQGPARLHPQGPAAHHHDQRPGALPDRADQVQVRAARPVRHVGQRRTACRTRRRWSTTWCFIRSMHTEAINHEPAVTFMQTGNQVTGRPCLGAWVSYGLGSLNHNLPTFVVMVAKPTQPGTGAGHLGPALAVGLPARRARGRRVPRGRRPGPLHQQPARRATPSVRRRRSTALNKLNQLNYSHESAIRRRRRASPSTRWPSGCRPACPELTDLSQGSREDARLCTARTSRSPARFANTRAHWPAGWSRRGVRFVQIYHHDWDHHGNLAGRMPDQCKRRRSALLRPDSRPEAARTARRHAGHLGRRVRPDDLLARAG